ncbi:MAG: hypothetical protein IJV62_01340 [Eggerthellaceae bacterium]|nr:hypothetical protein [Eggerthellaceae bacterium]
MQNTFCRRRSGIGVLLFVLLSLFVVESSFSSNAYAQEVETVVLELQLSLLGDDAPETSFEIQVSSNEGSPAPLKTSYIATASFHQPRVSVDVSFEFSDAGIYTYTLSQVQGSHPGITYDTTSYTIEIEVFENNGALASVVRASKDGNSFSKTGTISFVNEYKPTNHNGADRNPSGDVSQGSNDSMTSSKDESLSSKQTTFATTSDRGYSHLLYACAYASIVLACIAFIRLQINE